MNVFRLSIITVLIPFITGCSPIYIAKAAVEQFKIITSKEPIEEVIKDPKYPEEIKIKLSFIRQAKEFSHQIGLSKNGSFSSYVDIGREEFSWIVMASKKTSFSTVGWWFPIVGTVPYKGFFHREQADEYAKSLENDGLESWVRPTDAYSTLGWFDDPVLSPLLKRSIPDLVETVLHEQFHSTYWFKDNVPFNETAANIVGLVSAIAFFEQSPQMVKNEFLPKAISNLANTQVFNRFINDLYTALNKIYLDTALSEQEKIVKREQVFSDFIAPIKSKNPKFTKWDKVNNAQILQSRTYLTGFDKLYEQYLAAGSAKDFIATLGEQFKKCQDDNVCPINTAHEQK